MTSVKKKRSDPLVVQPVELTENSVVQLNSFSQQPIVLGPVIDHGNPILENSHIQVMENSNIIATDPNGRSNTFIVMPQNGNTGTGTQTILQSIPVYLLVPTQQSDKAQSTQDTLTPPPAVDNTFQPTEAAEETIVIKDVRTIKSEEEEIERYPETIYLDSIDDPLNLPLPEVDKKEINPLKHRSLYRCDFPNCSQSFLYPHDRKVHRESHIFSVGAEYKCSLCNMTFEKAIDRNKHVEAHSVPNTYKCKFCKANFPYYTTLIRHMNKSCFWDEKFKCKYCNIAFANRWDVRKHELKLHVTYNNEKSATNTKVNAANTCPKLRKVKQGEKAPTVYSNNVIVLD